MIAGGRGPLRGARGRLRGCARRHRPRGRGLGWGWKQHSWQRGKRSLLQGLGDELPEGLSWGDERRWLLRYHSNGVRLNKQLRSPARGFKGLDETESVESGFKTTDGFLKDAEEYKRGSLFRGMAKASPTGGRVPGL